MRKNVFLLLFVVLLSQTGIAQSGRKTDAPLTPPNAVETETQYSESVPKKTRSAIAGDVRRSDGKNDLIPEKTIADAANAEDIVKVETNLVTIPVSVFNRNGTTATNLQQADFKIYEDGVEQEIAYFAQSEKPFTVILLLDTSPSTEYKIEEIQAAAIAFVNQLKAQDSVMVIEFDENINVLTKATTDRRKIHKAIKKADFGGGTSLYDAVDFSLGKAFGKIEGRKAVVLFTDGVDTTSSKASYDSTLRRAEEADALIFPIYYNTFIETRKDLPAPSPDETDAVRIIGTSAEEYAIGKKYLADLSDYTGGRIFETEESGGLNSAFAGIAEELRRQYSLGYYPANAAPSGQRKSIKVRVNRPNLVIRSRDSYIAGSDQTVVKSGSAKNK